MSVATNSNVLALPGSSRFGSNSIRESSTPSCPRPLVTGDAVDALLNALTVEALSATECHWRPGWISGRRIAIAATCLVIVRGSGTCRRRGKGGGCFHSGDLILLPAKAQYAIENAFREETVVYVLQFRAQIFGALDLLSLLGFPIMLSVPGTSYLTVARRLVREFASKAPGWRRAMNAELSSMLFRLLRKQTTRLRPEFPLASISELPRFVPVFRHVEKNLHRPEYSVQEMARQANLSEVQFRKIFRRITGTSPLRFVQRQRIERACGLLKTSTKSISVIAVESGFCEPSFFHRVFKTWVGMTPRAFRKAARF